MLKNQTEYIPADEIMLEYSRHEVVRGFQILANLSIIEGH